MMMGITAVCCRLIGELAQALGALAPSSSAHHVDPKPTGDPQMITEERRPVYNEFMLRVLTAVFGMQNNGKINKEKARQVVEKLGLVDGEGDQINFDDDEVPVEEVLQGLEDGSKRNELLLEAFKIFDVDGNGLIDATELKRVLQCLGLDNGWDMAEIGRMLQVVDLNLDGKVDFGEFELMMG